MLKKWEDQFVQTTIYHIFVKLEEQNSPKIKEKEKKKILTISHESVGITKPIIRAVM